MSYKEVRKRKAMAFLSSIRMSEGDENMSNKTMSVVAAVHETPPQEDVIHLEPVLPPGEAPVAQSVAQDTALGSSLTSPTVAESQPVALHDVQVDFGERRPSGVRDRRAQAAQFLSFIGASDPGLAPETALPPGTQEVLNGFPPETLNAVASPPRRDSQTLLDVAPALSSNQMPSDGFLNDDQSAFISLNTSEQAIFQKRSSEAMVPVESAAAMLSKQSRIVLVTPLGYPIVSFSILRFYDEKTRKKQAAAAAYLESMSNLDPLKRRRVAESFQQLLHPAEQGVYQPALLDDPELRTGKHRTVIALPCYMGSIIQYTRPSDLKSELNDQFKQKHPDLDPDISLSKIRNLKASMLKVAEDQDLELVTVACAYVYFEKLVLKNYVAKGNRRLVGAVCLLLATKVMDKKDFKYTPLLQSIEKELGVSSKEIREHEFPVFVQLEFNLLLSPEEYLPHLDRILLALDFKDFQEYLTFMSLAAQMPKSAS